MAGLGNDIHIVEYGVPEGGGLVAYGVGATQQLYYGDVALMSGSGSTTTGYLKSTTSPGTADLVVGMIGEAAGGTYVQTGPGILGGSTDGLVQANVRQGAFFIQSGTGANALSAATNGKVVYFSGSIATGPVANATSSSGAWPALGVQLPQDPGISNGIQPGSSYWPIKIGANQVGGV